MPPIERTISCRRGDISLWDSRGAGPALLMLHGTGAAKDVFESQFSSSLAQDYRLIAMDLPGHGRSMNTDNPEQGYSLEGFASTVFEVVDALALAQPVVLGWSLGGHVAIDMIRIRPNGVSGVMLAGAPPTGHGTLAMLRAFQIRPELLLVSKPKFSKSEAERFAALCYGHYSTPHLTELIRQSDGRSRPIIARALVRQVPSQRETIESTSVPIAIVNGELDPIVRLPYLRNLSIKALWQGRPLTVAGAGHAPFLQDPQYFNFLTGGFLRSLADWTSATSKVAITSR